VRSTPSTLLNNILTFWLSHAAAGIYSLPGVFAHLMLMLKLLDTHGIQYVYE